jgi:diadenosine tetraphosphate (Ap4A) HIT family hydrolase
MVPVTCPFCIPGPGDIVLWNESDHLWDLVFRAKEYLDQRFSPDGYNIGINDGESAGQTIMHLHIHLIPRYKGDMVDPGGGVRGAIPEKQKY